MPCQIQDTLYAYSTTLTPIPQANQQVFAVPSANTLRISVSSQYRTLALNPNITTAPFREGIVATTDASGQFSFTLPYGATETKPNSPLAPWSLVFPDGKVVTGVVPSVVGPLLIDDLISTHGWTWTTNVEFTAPTSGVEARGTAVFTGQTSVAIVFLTPMSSSAYQLTLTPKEDTTVPGYAPGVFWSSKTTTGFIINTDATYTGEVDWIATL